MATYSLQAHAPYRSAHVAHNFTLRLNLVTHCSRNIPNISWHIQTVGTSHFKLRQHIDIYGQHFHDGGVTSDKTIHYWLSFLIPSSQIKKGTSYPKKRSAEVSDTTQQVKGEVTRSAPNI